MGMKDARLHIVGLESLDDTASDPSNPDMVNKAWFYMFGYKVIACPKAYSHDWGACPYAHQNESARRRDPQLFDYSSCICPNTSKGECPHGTSCRYAHTLFEYWLHPARFRTQMCKAGGNCRRALCFFAHSAAELRMPNRSAGWAHSRSSNASASAAGGDGARLGGGHAGLPLQPSFDDLQAAAAASASLVALSACSAAAAGCMMSGSIVSDSCGSNVSASSCLRGASPGHLDAATSFGVCDLDGGPASRPTGLQLAAPAGVDRLSGSVAAATAGLCANSPGGLSTVQQCASSDTGAALLADSAAAAAGVVTMPQLWLQQAQQQQQQQQQLLAAASMAATSVPFAASLEMMSLQTATQQHPMVAALMGPPPTAAASAGMVLSAPLPPSAVLQGLTACVPGPYAPMLLQQQQQPPASLAMAVQQMYQQRGMMMRGGGGGLQYMPWL